MEPLFFYTEPDAVSLWWDKPDCAAARQRYEVFLDGAPAAAPEKTHLYLTGLPENSRHTAQVRLPGQNIFAECTFTTGVRKRRVNVTEPPYCAAGDGTAMNTAALQRALDDCGPDECVWLPAGVYLTGALRLHSNMELYLDEGAVLLGSSDPADYLPRIHSRFEGTEMECYQSLLNLGSLDHNAGPDCENVIIRGRGSITGGGWDLARSIMESERARLKEYLAAHADYAASCENENTIPARARGRLIQMNNCKNIRISGLHLADGASWNVHFIYSSGIVTDHCTFHSTGIWNGDGWDPDSSEDCVLFACEFDTEDDCVAVKSGKNPEGNLIARPTRNIRIFDCVCKTGHGLCIGSEMSGGVENVSIWDCDLRRSMVGVQIKGTKKRGGYVRNIRVRDCIVPCLLAQSVPYNDDGIPAPQPPVFEQLRYERVTVTGRSLKETWTDCPAIDFCGFDAAHEIRDVQFRDITVPNGAEIRFSLCWDINFRNLCSHESQDDPARSVSSDQ